MENKKIDRNKLFNINYSYPDILDDRLQEKLFLKKELNNYQIKHKPEINNYNDLFNYRLKKCRQFQLSEHQQLLSNFFNPDTPYKSLLLFHGLGTGKTCCALKIASKFYEQIKKYNTRIIILVPGPVLKQNWINEIKKNNGACSNLNIIDDKDDKKIFEYYDIMSYKAFHRRVLGEKIKNKDDNKKSKYIKIESGDFLRNEAINKIDKLDNTLLIVDEAHNVIDNDYTNAIKKILSISNNLKLLLLTGTPMRNDASNIIQLLEIMNIANGNNHKIPPIFTGFNHNLNFTEKGEEILNNELKGKFSYLSGGDKYIFASRNDLGIIPKSLKFTKIIPCEFNDEQYKLYDEVVKNNNNGLERSSSDVCNFIIPVLKNNNIVLSYGINGLNDFKNNLENDKKDFINELVKYINKRIDKNIYKLNYDKDLIYLDKNQLTGKFLFKPYLKLFSPKFYKALTNILDLVEGKKGPKTAFIYSNLVQIGINIFKQILIQNGFIEFTESPNKTLIKSNDNTICYYCGINKKNHNNIKHEYFPASFVFITGKQENDEDFEDNEDVQMYINKYFNSKENYEGKFIKLILGSQVISEGYSFQNISEVHILDVYYNFTRIDQAVGRGIRTCSHFNIENELNPYPKVDIYKYCMYNKNNPTSEELLYQKAEKKHVLIKYVERMIKNNAIDKLLFMQNNYNKDLINNNKNCIQLKYGDEFDKQILNDNEKNNICPSVCDYMNCNYYTKEELDFINNNNPKIDVSTFTNNMIDYEIERCINIIKYMYLIKFVYNLNEIIDYVFNFYKNEVNEKLYDVYYVYKALDKLIPITDNDFNNYNINLRDKFNNLGYLIYVNNYYIFQKNNETEDLPMYYREHNDLKLNIPLTLNKFLNDTNEDYKKFIKSSNNNNDEYDFITTYDYYNNKEENNIVGIIDKNKNNEVFKVRDKINIKTNLKRQTGLSNYTGAVCFNAYSYNELVNKLKKLGVKINIPSNRLKRNRFELCNKIKDILLNLEKYNNDNITYCIIPANHPIYEFPYNIHDRVKYITNQLSNKYPNISINIKKDKNKYYISILNKDYDKDLMNKFKFVLNGKLWERFIE